MNIKSSWRVPLSIMVAVFLAYLNAFKGVFQFDDYNVIVDNPVVHSVAGWVNDLGHGIRPVLKLSYMLNWISGWGIFGFHLVNIGLHGANAILVYCLTCKFTDRFIAVENSKSLNVAALLAALLFALHPVQTEAVTYICGRSTSLMTFFYLSSLLVYIAAINRKNAFGYYLFSVFLFLCAVATKEVAITLPAALLLWEGLCGQDNWQKRLKRQAGHWLILLLLAAALLMHSKYLSLLLYGFEERSLYANLLSQINAVMYLISSLFSLNLLNIDPDLPVITQWSFLGIFQLTLLLGLLLIAFQNTTRKPWIGFGILWFFLHLLPTNSFIPRLDVVNERQLYLAGVGIFLSVSFEVHYLSTLLTVHRKYLYSGIGIVLLLLGFYTVMRNHDYRSQIALWEDTAGKSPHKARVLNNLGVAYELEGDTNKAVWAYTRSLQLDAGYTLARDNLQNLTVPVKYAPVHP